MVRIFRTSPPFPYRFGSLFRICGLLMLVSEIWKQVCLTFFLNHGSYDWRYFPFQLCSIPMYILLLLPYTKTSFQRRTCFTFLMTFGLLGGIAVFADTSGLHYPLPLLTFHSYAWHVLLIGIGILSAAAYDSEGYAPLSEVNSEGSAVSRKIRSADAAVSPESISADAAVLPQVHSKRRSVSPCLRDFKCAALLYLACCVAAAVINHICGRFGIINMFYINPAYRMEQIIFYDLVPLLGNLTVIFLYIGMTILGAGLLFLLWKLLLRYAAKCRIHHSGTGRPA